MMSLPQHKRKTTAGSVPLGEWCHPRGSRPSGSYLRTQWRVAGVNREGQVVLRLGRQVRLLAPTESVLVNRPTTPE